MTRGRLISFWIHWVVANAAGFGALGAWTMFFVWFGSSVHPVRQDVVSYFAGLTLIVGYVAYLQQLMLRSVGMQAKYWVLTTVCGLPVAGFLAAVVGDIVFYLVPRTLSFEPAIKTALVASSFILGFMFGLIQFIAARRGYGEHLLWSFCSGVAFGTGTALTMLLYDFNHPTIPINIFTLLGALYGCISGGGLCFLLSHPPKSKLPAVR